ncbi:ABC transporter permease [Thermoflexus sp.]|uniref:ABC transporter permease n=1 Tax=Thermoflexus sp. TaxID=1969742 RepID=UPI002ADDA1C4|nr:ABC transporter permease [Thermoflexus sp.]
MRGMAGALARGLTRERILLVIVVGLLVVIARLTPKFLTATNLQITSRYLVEVGLVAIPMTMIILIRGIDISVGSMVALSTIVLGFSWNVYQIPMPLAVLLALGVATFCGFLNGIAITRLRVPDLVVTLSTLAIYRGIAEGLGGGGRVYLYEDPLMRFLGEGQILGIPVGLWIFLPAVAAAGVMLDRSAWGRSLYAIGHNETAARFAGMRVDRIRLLAYTLSGLASGLSAIFLAGRLGTARATAGLGLEFEVITAVVVGGTAISGGEGSIWGSFLGVVMVTALRNGLNLIGVPSPIQAMIIGVLLILTVLVNENLRLRIRGWVRPIAPALIHEAEPVGAANPSSSQERR